MMGETILALLPVVVMALVHFGMEAARVIALSCMSAVLCEALCLALMKRDITIDDYSGLLTGLLFALLLPASAPWWLVIAGASSCIILGKMIFGGLGANPLCIPAVGWAVCRVSWGDVMDVDFSMLSSAFLYPLSTLKYSGIGAVSQFSMTDLFMGRQLGGLGSVQIAGVLSGGVFLLFRGHIRPHIPLAFLSGVAVTAWISWTSNPCEYASPLFHVMTGSVLLGAFFLATDPGSSPSGSLSMILFGLLGGILVMLIRIYSVYPDGVALAILMANLTTPLLDRIGPQPFGTPR
jgi:electron transport complex protein RnfD